MRHPLIVAGIATMCLVPSVASAQQTCEERRNNRAAGTVVGGLLGALAGSAVAGRGDRTEGAVIGGVGGAVVGNQVSKGSGDCRRAYGYYDNQNNWHSTGVDRTAARGYYDRNGNWIDGAPPTGGWDRDGRWAANAGAYGSAANYTDRSDWRDAPQDIAQRSEWLERRIVRSRNNGQLSRREAQRAMDTLSDIRREERRYYRDGRLTDRESYTLMSKLDALNSQIRWDRRD